MFLIILLIQLALIVVFGMAGFTKLLDRRGSRNAIENFGAPQFLVPVVALLLPLLEIAIAIGLLFTVTASYSAIAAVGLLAIFIAVIGMSIVRGQAPECHCFGQLYSRPVGWSTLVRNLIFAVAASVLVWFGPVNGGPVLQISALFLLIVFGVIVVYLQRRSKKVQDATLAPTGLPVGSTAPPFDLPHYEGGRGSLAQLLDQKKPVLLIFTSPLCGPCVSLFKEIGEWQRTHREEITVAIVSRGTIKENFVNTVRNGLQNVLLQTEYEVAELYRSKVTPTALLIEPDGTIASLLAAGADQIRVLLGKAINRI